MQVNIHGLHPSPFTGEFEELREAQRKRTYPTTDARERCHDDFYASYPAAQRYNDIAGYAEVYWDGGSGILASFF